MTTMIEYAVDDWRARREHSADESLCPCDNHPSDQCETCRGACSCHWVDVDMPYVCPGCHAVGEERCAPGCIDAEIAERDWYDDCDVTDPYDDEENGEW